ncbi:MAG: hypothetical protein A2V86_05225 [Deltaproteobacteria bacterium RBG_16_49_23]|nr:MAG: hypothetical protein A2V86_05225 [Deltaproteobacteria bacterium RBG_16_49_23]
MVAKQIKNSITAYGSAILKILKQIFIGPAFVAPHDFKPTYTNLADQLNNIWNDKSVGLNRIFKLSLLLIQFVNPFNVVCHCFDRISAVAGALFTDAYVILKLLVSLGLIYIFRTSTCAVLVISSYIIIETVLYLLRILFLSPEGNKPISPKRSLVMLFINYFTITLSFAAIYRIPGFIPCITQPINAVYFSFVISSTLGLGNYVPIGENGQIVVIFQIITTIFFLTIFFTHFLSRLQEKGD